MGYALDHGGFGALTAGSSDSLAQRASAPRLLRRFYNAFMSARQRQADSDIERYFMRSGKVLTDTVEREMMQRAMSGNWTARK